jgi:hypothetical protein
MNSWRRLSQRTGAMSSASSTLCGTRARRGGGRGAERVHLAATVASPPGRNGIALGRDSNGGRQFGGQLVPRVQSEFPEDAREVPFDVRAVMNSVCAISRLVRPSLANSATRRSLAVSDSSPVRRTRRGRAPVARSSVPAYSASGLAPERWAASSASRRSARADQRLSTVAAGHDAGGSLRHAERARLRIPGRARAPRLRGVRPPPDRRAQDRRARPPTARGGHRDRSQMLGSRRPRRPGSPRGLRPSVSVRSAAGRARSEELRR